LCYGWIDGIMKRIDDREHTIRFSPRKKNSFWSESNLDRVKRLLAEDRMMESGIRIYENRDKDRSPPSVKYRGKDVKVPEYIEKILKEDRDVWDKFRSMAPSHKNQFVGWIDTAKKEETRLRRARKAVEMIREEIKRKGEK